MLRAHVEEGCESDKHGFQMGCGFLSQKKVQLVLSTCVPLKKTPKTQFTRSNSSSIDGPDEMSKHTKLSTVHRDPWNIPSYRHTIAPPTFFFWKGATICSLIRFISWRFLSPSIVFPALLQLHLFPYDYTIHQCFLYPLNQLVQHSPPAFWSHTPILLFSNLAMTYRIVALMLLTCFCSIIIPPTSAPYNHSMRYHAILMFIICTYHFRY